MLFSNKKVAKFIQDNFEPVWISLRPVPLVTIDFGNGKIVRRTLHGNIASFVCSPEGKILDILPGLYEPSAYMTSLQDLVRLNLLVGNQLLEKDQIRILRNFYQTRTKIKGDSESKKETVIRLDDSKTLADAIKEDTKLNERHRRRLIHSRLLQYPLATPAKLTKWLYREVLNADLDDPYLGLGSTIFGTKGRASQNPN